MLAGSLSEFSMLDVFTLLSATKKTGIVKVQSKPDVGRVWIDQGRLSFAVADVTRAPVVSRLLHESDVDADAVRDLVDAHRAEGPTTIPQTLISSGISSERAAGLLHDQIVDAVFDMSRWRAGSFTFDAHEPGANADDQTGWAATEIMDAVDLRLSDWEQIETAVPSPDHVLQLVTKPPVAVSGSVQIEPDQWEILTLVDGRRQVRDIISMTGQGRFVVTRLIAEMVTAGLITATDAPAEDEAADDRFELLAAVEEEILDAEPRAVVPTTAPATTEPRSNGKSDGKSNSKSNGTETADGSGSTDESGASDDVDAVDDIDASDEVDLLDEDGTESDAVVVDDDLLSRLIGGVGRG